MDVNHYSLQNNGIIGNTATKASYCEKKKIHISVTEYQLNSILNESSSAIMNLWILQIPPFFMKCIGIMQMGFGVVVGWTTLCFGIVLI